MLYLIIVFYVFVVLV